MVLEECLIPMGIVGFIAIQAVNKVDVVNDFTCEVLVFSELHSHSFFEFLFEMQVQGDVLFRHLMHEGHFLESQLQDAGESKAFGGNVDTFHVHPTEQPEYFDQDADECFSGIL